MTKLQSMWSDLPVNVKRSIVKLLDYKSRCRLRVCSKRDRNLVDSLPVFLKSLEVLVTTNRPALLFVKDQTNSYLIYNNIVENFCNTFKHQKSIVQKVVIACSFDVSAQASNEHFIINQLIRTISSDKNHFKVRALKMVLWIHGLPDHYFQDLFQAFDAKCLKSITWKSSLTPILIERISKSEGWRRAKQFRCYDVQDASIDLFLRGESLRLFIMDLPPDGIRKLINCFTTRECPKSGDGFRISFVNSLNIKEAASLFNLTQIDQPVHGFDLSYSLTQRFPTSSDNIVFVANIGMHLFEGYYCRVKHQDEDFKRQSYLNNRNLIPCFRDSNKINVSI